MTHSAAFLPMILGGHVVRAVRLCNALRERHREEVQLFWIDFGRGREVYKPVYHGPNFRVHHHPFANPYNTLHQLEHLVNGRCDVLLLNGEPLECHLAVRLRQKGVRIVSVASGATAHYMNIAKKFAGIIDFHVATSTAVRAKLIELLGADKNIRYIPTGVSWEPLLRASTLSSTVHLLYVGSLDTAIKGLDQLPELLTLLEQQSVTFEVCLIGQGPGQQELETILTRFIAKGYVKFCGVCPIEAVWKSMAKADVFLLFSRSEGFPNALLEAMAQGAVPVVMEFGSASDAIEHGVNGFIVPQGDVAAMSRIIIELANDKSRLKELGVAAQRTISSRFTVERMADDYYRLFQEARGLGSYSGPVPNIPLERSRLDLPWMPNWLSIGIRKIRGVIRTLEIK